MSERPGQVCPTYRRSAAGASGNAEVASSDDRARATCTGEIEAVTASDGARPSASTACWAASPGFCSWMPFNGIDIWNEHAHVSGLRDSAFGKIGSAQVSRGFKPDEAQPVGRMLKDVAAEVPQPRIKDRSPVLVVVAIERETADRKGGSKRTHR